MADAPKMRDVFRVQKKPLTPEELETRFPELAQSMPGGQDIESYDMGDGIAISRWGKSEDWAGFPHVWMNGKVYDLYDLEGSEENSYDFGDEGRAAGSIAQEAFGDGFWTDFIDPDWAKTTKARMDKVDQRLSGARPGASWEEMLGSPDEEEKLQKPAGPKKFMN